MAPAIPAAASRPFPGARYSLMLPYFDGAASFFFPARRWCAREGYEQSPMFEVTDRAAPPRAVSN